MAEPYNQSNDKDEAKESSDEEILRVARERFDLAEEMWRDVFQEGMDDLRFLSGEQWLEADKKARQMDGRPCLTVNRLPQFTRQIVNDQKQNKVSIKVSPVDDKADVATAKVRQGLIRHIEQTSGADQAYGRAFECAVENSFGFFRIRTDYVSPTSFEQQAIIEKIPDPFLVKYDPYFKKADGSDSNWAFLECVYSKDDYKAEYGESSLGKEGDWESFGKQYHGWINEKSVRVCEYYFKEFKKVELVKLSTGEVIEKSRFTDGIIDPLSQQPIIIVSEKLATIPVIRHLKINGLEILEKSIFPGKYIPVIPVLGKESIVDGKRVLESLIRHAKDPQRMLNYWVTCETETIALAPKAPFIAAEGQIPEAYKEMWRTANSKTHSVLLYKPTSLGGQVLPPPQRNVYEAPVQAITNARMQSSDDLKATTGMYDAAMGARSNENSGIAIQRRSAQAQTSNFHFLDNLTVSIRHCGKILLDITPDIYDTARMARIIGDEGDEQIVPINQEFEEHGEKKNYDLSVGEYDVIADTGPSFATKRQEAVASMVELTKAYPNMVAIAGDLMVKNMDWPGSQEISERLKKTLPPGLAEDKNQKPIPPEAQAQMQQMSQMIEGLTAKLNQANEDIKTKVMELESKERIEMAKLEQQATIELAKLESREATTILTHQISELNQRMKLLGINEPIEDEFNGSGPEQAVNPNIEPQPTGGLSPGPYMGA